MSFSSNCFFGNLPILTLDLILWPFNITLYHSNISFYFFTLFIFATQLLPFPRNDYLSSVGYLHFAAPDFNMHHLSTVWLLGKISAYDFNFFFTVLLFFCLYSHVDCCMCYCPRHTKLYPSFLIQSNFGTSNGPIL